MSRPTSGLRFGALVRVSTEKQEQQGESLRTQRSQIERDVAQLGAQVVAWPAARSTARPATRRSRWTS
jgi:hypothetical protein